jgi:hypothetical protein
MNRRYIEKSIPEAIKLIKENNKIYHPEKKQVPNEFVGYVSSFAVAITLSGAFQATIFYQEAHKANFPREEMLEVIAKLMGVDNLLEHLKDNPLAKERLIDSAMAFKMALRVFELKKGMTPWVK